MHDLLAGVLVGLVVLTAVVSVYVILTGSSEPYSDKCPPRSDANSQSGLNNEIARFATDVVHERVKTVDRSRAKSGVQRSVGTERKAQKIGSPS